MRPADRQLTAVWGTLAALGLCVMIGFLLIYHLFGVEHADRRAQQAQTAQEITAQHEALCGFAAAIPLPATDTPYLQELERRAHCPLTVPTPLPTATATRTVTVPGPGASRAPVGAAEPHAQPTVIITAPTGPAPTRPAPSATPSSTPPPSMRPTPPVVACLLGHCIG